MLKPPSCVGCPIALTSNGWILSEGDGSSGVVILGEGGGYNEYVENLPFRPHAQSGSKLEEVFRLVSRELGYPVTRSQFLLYNVLNCNPREDVKLDKPWVHGAMAHCRPNVDRVIGGFQTNKTKTILALGNLSLVALTGVSGIAEEKQSISHLRGYVFESKYGLVVPALHPSFVRRGNNHLTPLLVEDLKKAIGVAKGTYTNYYLHPYSKTPEYQLTPGLDEAWSFYNRVRDNPRAILAYDIETAETGNVDEDERDELKSVDIIQCQFSIKKSTGIAMPFRDNYLDVIQALFALPNVKANHNTYNFDNPRLKAKGIKLKGGLHDTMWMFKHWHPKLPRGLQSVVSLLGFPFPWKHLYSTNLEWYGCADVDAVQWIVEALPKLMRDRGVWDGYRDHIYHIHPIMERARETGIPVSEDKRIALEAKFREERKAVDKEIQAIVPETIRNIRPKRKDKETGEEDYGYKRQPKLVEVEFNRYNELAAQNPDKKFIPFEDYLYKKHNLACWDFQGEFEVVKRWAVVEPFKASSTQMIRYLEWKQKQILDAIVKLKDKRQKEFDGRNPELTAEIRSLQELADDYEVPRDLKTKHKTTGKHELEEMFNNTGDSLLEKVVKIRSIDTNLNNYLPNWTPGRDGRVHTTWGYSAPTGQFDSRRPNILNCSKHTDYGKEFRGIIEAPPGYVFVEFDYKSFHVATAGYCANDKDYIRYSQLDPHSILGSYIDPSVIGGSISLRWSDADIRMATKEFKARSRRRHEDNPHIPDIRQALAKPTVLGNQLELGARKLQRQNRQYIHFVNKLQREYHKEKGYSAEELQTIVVNLFPKIPLYQKQIKEKAFKEKYLINEFGYIQYFYDIYNFTFSKKTGKWDRREGEGAREPIAFRVQGCAFGLLHLALLECEMMRYNEEYQFVNSIHDSIMYMPEKSKLDRCIESVRPILVAPCHKLVNEATGPDGLSVGADCSVGTNWRDMEEIKV
jgi:uracil-DNA glycosylase family 4